MSSSEIEGHKNLSRILNNINTLHTSIFGQFHKQTAKRKITNYTHKDLVIQYLKKFVIIHIISHLEKDF
jgi:hypothetical protein